VTHRKLKFILGSFVFLLALIWVPSCNAAAQTWYSGSNPPAGYLTNHMITNAIQGDLETTTPGEYCNYYGTGIDLLYQSNTNVSNTTGFDTGTTRSDWQQGDISSANVCQSRGNTWGFKVSGAANNNCSAPIMGLCGMHHFVRLSNGDNNRPWSNSYGSSPAPALTLSLDSKPHAATGGETFGYICPILKDTAAPVPRYIEYCFIEWRSTNLFPASFPKIDQYDDLGDCASTNPPYTPADVDIIFTAFQNNLNWGTHRSGSTGTSVFSQTNRHLTASITKQNLQNVITRLNTPVTDNDNDGDNDGGCNRGLSTDVNNYALVGYEQGVEGRGFSSLGASVSNVQIQTATDTLYPGDRLTANQSMYSATGGYRLTMQGDGNLVLYDNNNQWQRQTYTQGNPGAYLEMQSDGNLVLYNASRTSALWHRPGSSYTMGSYATLQPDMNFVLYNGNQAKWSWN
jgi:hypothetical protein